MFPFTNHNIDRFQTALSHSFRQLLAHRRQSLTRPSRFARSRLAQHILERGFSVVKNTRGQVIRNADTLKQGRNCTSLLPTAKPTYA